MLQSISWGDYFSSLLFVAIIYYVAIGYLYFRNELLKLAGITRHEPDRISVIATEDLGATQHSELIDDSNLNPSTDIDITPVVQAFIGEAEAYLEQAAADKSAKQEILYALQQISARYPILANSDNKVSLAKDIHNLTCRYFPGAFTTSELKPYLFS